MADPHWTTVLSALLTPTIAVFGAIIAWWQWRTAQNRLKLDLFDRRFAVYEVARSLLASIITSGKAQDDALFKFLSGTREAKWLLSSDVADYLEQHLYHKAVNLQTLSTVLEGMTAGDTRR